MSESKPRRKLAAILAADVVGFSRKMGENEDRTLHNLKACRDITDESPSRPTTDASSGVPETL